MVKCEKKVYALKASAKIAGVHRQRKVEHEDTDGETVTKSGSFTETVEHRLFHKSAKAFATVVSGLPDRFALYNENLDAYITDEAGARAFRAALAKIEEEIGEFNAQPGNPHEVTLAPYTGAREYSTVIEAADLQSMYTQAQNALTEARAALDAGDHALVTNWLKRQHKLPAMLPTLNASVVESAIEAIRDAKNYMAAAMREEHTLDDVKASDEYKNMLDAVDAAFGWLAPHTAAPATSDASGS